MDSVFSVFYVIANGNLAISKQLIVSYLHIFKSDLSLNSDNFGALMSIWCILKKYDDSYYHWLRDIIGSDDSIAFALEWYISWFAHSSISDFDLILRIYDFMIASVHQQVGLYMVVAVLLCNQKEIRQNVDCLVEFIHFSKHGIVFDKESVECLIKKCNEIMVSERKKEMQRNSRKKGQNELRRSFDSVKHKLCSINLGIEFYIRK